MSITSCKMGTEDEEVADNPVFDIEGEVDYNDTVTITTATEGADIFYTVDGTEPTTESAKYTEPVVITDDCTIKAVTVKTDMQNSAIVEKSFTIKKYTITFDAKGHGTAPEAISGKHKGEVITLPGAITEEGFTFSGWSDGINTYAAGASYTVSGNITLSAVWTDWSTVAAPVFSVTDSQVDYNDTVIITTATAGATIYYTTDGTTPTSSSTPFSTAIPITSATTLKAIAIKTGMNNSAVSEKSYTIKTYTVTFSENGHGTAPEAISGKYKGEVIQMPAALTASLWRFDGWSDGTNTFAAGANYTVSENVTLSAVWTDVPPANVTNLTATCIASETVKLTWTNPTDADFAKVVITYGTDGSVEVLKTASPNDQKTITGLTNGTQYTFTVKAIDEAGNASSGVSVNAKPFSGTTYTAGTNGGLVGYTNQTQGAVLTTETWMNSTNGNIIIGGTEIARTSEVIAVPTGTVAEVTMPDDSSWNTYYSINDSSYQGVFLSGRKVKFDPFVMSQYEVTQKLYLEVMGANPSAFSSDPDGEETQNNRPVEYVTWYQACAFCNELTKKTFGDTTTEYVYYSDSGLTTPYTAAKASSKATVYPAYNTTTKKWTKTGYRLPTEAEWEFCARGGNPNAVDINGNSIWSYAYAGVQTQKSPSNFTSSPYEDAKLDEVAWNDHNSNKKTHEVGLKTANTLNLYDMSGNVWEWCYDTYDYNKPNPTSNDSAYKVDGYVVNPLGISAGNRYNRCCRGGSYSCNAHSCSVSYRKYEYPEKNYRHLGFRVCRSTSD